MARRIRAQQLNGLFPLSYMGVVPVSPVNFIIDDRPPTQNDSKNFYIGDLWLVNDGLSVPTNEDIYMLVDLTGNIATWVNFGGGDLETLTGNSGGAVGPDAADNINVIGDGVGITIAGNPGTNTLTASLVGGGVAAQSFPTDSGTATPNAAGVLNILTQNATLGCGSTVLFSAPGPSNTIQLNVTDAFNNTIMGINAGNLGFSGAIGGNTGFGRLVFSSITDGFSNTAIGNRSQQSIQGGGDNTSAGNFSLSSATSAESNSAFGNNCLTDLTVGNNNSAFGSGALSELVSGDRNLALGFAAALSYTTNESNNIIIGNSGTALENNTIRIGTTGGGAGQQNRAFLAGVNGITVSNQSFVTMDTSTEQLGNTTFASINFTPTLSFGGSSVGITYATQEGKYQTLGNLVFYSAGIVLTNKGAAAGIARLEGLPFASSGTATVYQGYLAINDITLSVGYTYAWGKNDVGTTSIILVEGGSGVAAADMTDVNFANNSAFTITGFYFRN